MPEIQKGNARTGERKSELVCRSQLLLQYLLAFDHLLDTPEAGGVQDPGLRASRADALPEEGFTD
ncbi:MAG: hypothetical protein ABSH49_09695 [Bryobacteraceae bacterium]|jgi:hypothetical protein